VASERRYKMTLIPLSGWAAFRALRQSPAPIPRRRHGNWLHGRYSKGQINQMREVRRCVKVIWQPLSPPARMPPPTSPSADGTRTGLNQARLAGNGAGPADEKRGFQNARTRHDVT
jgi:hypothetical protein